MRKRIFTIIPVIIELHCITLAKISTSLVEGRQGGCLRGIDAMEPDCAEDTLGELGRGARLDHEPARARSGPQAPQTRARVRATHARSSTTFLVAVFTMERILQASDDDAMSTSTSKWSSAWK